MLINVISRVADPNLGVLFEPDPFFEMRSDPDSDPVFKFGRIRSRAEHQG